MSIWENHGFSAEALRIVYSKLSDIKKENVQPNIFFPQTVFSGADVWSQEYINRASRGHTAS